MSARKSLTKIASIILCWAFLSLAIYAIPRDEIARAREASYNLWTDGPRGKEIICTATVLDTNAGQILLSAGHCVADDPFGAYYISINGALVQIALKRYFFKSIDEWNRGDYAIFEAPVRDMPSLKPCQQLPKIGEPIFAWTGPVGMRPIFRSGYFSGVLEFPNDDEAQNSIGGMLFADIHGAGGSSGSGMLRIERGRACAWGIWRDRRASTGPMVLKTKTPDFCRASLEKGDQGGY